MLWFVLWASEISQISLFILKLYIDMIQSDGIFPNANTVPNPSAAKIRIFQWPLLLTWINFNPSMDK